MTIIYVIMISQILQKLGLKREESDIYKTCLEFGALPAGSISKKTGIPRTSIYVHTEKMIKEGFMTSLKKGASTYFIATEPNSLIQVFDKQKSLIQKNEDFLRQNLTVLNSFSRFSSSLPKVTYYEGVHSLDPLYESIKKSSTFLAYVNIESVREIAEDYVLKTIKIIKDNKINAREILTPSSEATKYQKKNSSANHLIKILPKQRIFHSDNIILDDRVFHISYNAKEGIIAIEIINDALVSTQRAMFEQVWEKL